MNDSPTKRFIERIIGLRRLHGWTQGELVARMASEYRIDRSSLARLEHGKRGLSLDEAVALAGVFELSVVDVLARQFAVSVEWHDGIRPGAAEPRGRVADPADEWLVPSAEKPFFASLACDVPPGARSFSLLAEVVFRHG